LDDAARFWIDDFLVFESADTLHSWYPNEGFRRITFKEGVNKVRGRVETKPGVCFFSMILLPLEADPALFEAQMEKLYGDGDED